MAERGYGWEKLMSEMFCQEYWHERGLKTFIARFHNVYGPCGTWDGGREKAPAAICRKVIEAKASGVHKIDIWGNGAQTRSFMYIDDCTLGIDKIMHCEDLIATPINLGSSELVSINTLGVHGGRNRWRETGARVPAGCAARRGRAKQRQHDDPADSRLGTPDAAARRTGQDLCLDRSAVC